MSEGFGVLFLGLTGNSCLATGQCILQKFRIFSETLLEDFSSFYILTLSHSPNAEAVVGAVVVVTAAVAVIVADNVAQFNYLGTTVTIKNLFLEEIKRGLNSSNACYHSVQNL
jgi:hypothetical protein